MKKTFLGLCAAAAAATLALAGCAQAPGTEGSGSSAAPEW